MKIAEILETERTNEAIKKPIIEKKELNNNQGFNNLDPIYFAFFDLLKAANTQQETARIQSQQLESNAMSQVRINDAVEQINYVSFAPGLSGNDLDEQIPVIQAQNQQIQKVIDGEENNDLLLRQNAQVTTTQLNTSLNNSEQTFKESSGMLSELLEISNLILR